MSSLFDYIEISETDNGKTEIKTTNDMKTLTVDGIIKKDNYTFWYKVGIVKPFIYEYLKNRFPDSLLIDEFNSIDFIVVNELLPVEIQSTLYNKIDNAVMHCGFENAIRKQIEDNIENYGKCWFFFDNEYYRYLSETDCKTISMNLDWLAKYVKEDKLKVFTIQYSGLIEELKYEDLEFIRNISNTCKIGYEDDERILNRNKLKIFKNVLKGYEFTQDEINRCKSLFNSREKIVKNGKISEKYTNFLIKNGDKRMKLYAYAWEAILRLRVINEFLDMKNIDEHVMFECSYIGLFDSNGVNRNKFVDNFNICQFFPGYLRHKEDWDRMKGGTFKISQLRELFYTYTNRNQGRLEF